MSVWYDSKTKENSRPTRRFQFLGAVAMPLSLEFQRSKLSVNEMLSFGLAPALFGILKIAAAARIWRQAFLLFFLVVVAKWPLETQLWKNFLWAAAGYVLPVLNFPGKHDGHLPATLKREIVGRQVFANNSKHNIDILWHIICYLLRLVLNSSPNLQVSNGCPRNYIEEGYGK